MDCDQPVCPINCFREVDIQYYVVMVICMKRNVLNKVGKKKITNNKRSFWKRNISKYKW